jgi:type I restriction enzyme M protein
MQPLLDRAAVARAAAVDLKDRLRRMKKDKAAPTNLAAVEGQIREQEIAARDLEGQAAAIDATVFDLKAVNPNATSEVDGRSPTEIIQSIQEQGRVVSEALARLNALLEPASGSTPANGARPEMKRARPRFEAAKA